MTDRQLIELGAREVAARQGFGAAGDMRQRDLEYLCDRIEESSGILISLSTIKRILNGQYNRLPQVATLNALSVYLGYVDWPSFKASKLAAAAQSAAAEKGMITAKRRPLRWRRSFIGAGIVLLVFVLTLSWNYLSKSSAAAGEATFTASAMACSSRATRSPMCSTSCT